MQELPSAATEGRLVVVEPEVAFGVEVAVGSRLVEARWGGGIHSVMPSAFLRVVQPLVEQPVIGPADEREIVDVGATSLGPFVDG